jgi:hypothetical protein
MELITANKEEEVVLLSKRKLLFSGTVRNLTN